MPKTDYFEIDGVQVRKSQPFLVYSGMPRNTSEFLLSEGGKSDKGHARDLTDFVKTLFHSPVEEIPEIDKQALQYRSVSSLRDFKLFSPPVPSYELGRMREEKEVKKTLFINEFCKFEY